MDRCVNADSAVCSATSYWLGGVISIAVTFLVVGINAPTFNCAARDNTTTEQQLQMSASQFISSSQKSVGSSDLSHKRWWPGRRRARAPVMVPVGILVVGSLQPGPFPGVVLAAEALGSGHAGPFAGCMHTSRAVKVGAWVLCARTRRQRSLFSLDLIQRCY